MSKRKLSTPNHSNSRNLTCLLWRKKISHSLRRSSWKWFDKTMFTRLSPGSISASKWTREFRQKLNKALTKYLSPSQPDRTQNIPTGSRRYSTCARSLQSNKAKQYRANSFAHQTKRMHAIWISRFRISLTAPLGRSLKTYDIKCRWRRFYILMLILMQVLMPLYRYWDVCTIIDACV